VLDREDGLIRNVVARGLFACRELRGTEVTERQTLDGAEVLLGQ
jgi:hypothetical protein